MKKNQSAAGIAKPHDADGSATITNLRDQRLAPPGKWAASSLILRCPIMTQNPSLTGWWGGRWWCLCVGGLCSHCVGSVHYSLNECPFLLDIMFQKKVQKKEKPMQAGAVVRQAGHKWCLSAMQTLFIFNMSQVNICIYISHTTSSCQQKQGIFFPKKAGILLEN